MPATQKENAEAVAKYLSEKLGALEDKANYTVRALTQTSVLMKGGAYRTKPLQGGQELFFTGVRAGKQSPLIFEFEPVDAQEYEQVEFRDHSAFDALLDFQGDIAELLEVELHEVEDMKQCCAVVHKRIIAEEKQRHEREAAEKARRQEESYGKMDGWGQF
ncbi:MAG: hypothetical protein JJ979_03515 [Roseibium sp.]|nr:hypothetical protein [Roseibium sp.]